MKLFNIDWEPFLGYAEAWAGLRRETRLALLELKALERGEAARFRDDLSSLVGLGLLALGESGERARLAEGFKDPAKVLRAMRRNPILASSDERELDSYCREHLTGEEREAMLGEDGWRSGHGLSLAPMVASASHLQGFLQAEDARAWEAARLPEGGPWLSPRALTETRPALAKPQSARDLRALLERLAAEPGPVRYRDLPQHLERVSGARLGRAVDAGLRYLLCFADLDEELEPVLGLWPPVHARLRRTPRRPPGPAEPRETLHHAWLMEDLVQLLVRAADPLRLKRDGSLFAKAQREVEGTLHPLPPWLVGPGLFPEHTPEQRLHRAMALASQLELTTEKGEPGRGLLLEVTPAGWEWLRESPRDRLAVLIDLVRDDPEAPDGGDGDGEESWDWIDEEEALELGLSSWTHDPRQFMALRLPGLSAHAAQAAGVLDALHEIFASFEPGHPVAASELLRYHLESSNPLLDLDAPQRFGIGSPWQPATEEQLEEIWGMALVSVLSQHLLPLGGVSTGSDPERGLTLEMTAVGHYLLGLTDDFEFGLAPAPSSGAVRIQPDFEVVFLAPSPSFEAAFSRFAVRLGTGVGALFRITRDSILTASRAGLVAEEVLETLTGSSAAPVPANVEHEIRSWFAQCIRLPLEPLQAIRCPDAETATRVLASAGSGKLEPLSETVLALTEPRHQAAVVRACRKAGVFLTPVEPPEKSVRTGSKRPRRRRRRARWS